VISYHNIRTEIIRPQIHGSRSISLTEIMNFCHKTWPQWEDSAITMPSSTKHKRGGDDQGNQQGRGTQKEEKLKN